MNLLVLIAARAGSLRIKNKNLKKINNISLLQNTINVAKKNFNNQNILLSTDCRKMLKIGKKNKILSPWLRPKSLSRSNTSSFLVAKHSINWYENFFYKIDGLLLLQPTTPYRNPNLVNLGLELFKKYKMKKKIIGMTELRNHQKNLFYLKKNRTCELKIKKNFLYVNGNFYLIPRNILLKEKKFCPKNSIPLISNKFIETIDIDTHEDLYISRKLLKR